MVVAALVDENGHVVAQVAHDVALLLGELLDQLRHRPAELGIKLMQIDKKSLQAWTHAWNKKFKIPFRTVVVGSFIILPTSTLMARIVQYGILPLNSL